MAGSRPCRRTWSAAGCRGATLIPAGASICLMNCAYCGISRNCSVVSVTLSVAGSRRVDEELLRLVDVLRALRDVGRRGRAGVDRRERVVVAEVGAAVEQALHEARPVERVRDRLADLLLVERVLVGPHLQRPVLARGRLGDRDVGVAEERLRPLEGHLREDVDRPALERQDDRRRVGEVLDLHGVQVRKPLAPVGRVLDIRRALVGRERLQDERAGPDPALRERADLVVRRQDDRVVVERRHEVREVAVRPVEVEVDRLLVDLLHVALGQHAREGRERGRADLGVGDPVERRDDVVDRERRAVLPLHALADRERPDVRRRARRPTWWRAAAGARTSRRGRRGSRTPAAWS